MTCSAYQADSVEGMRRQRKNAMELLLKRTQAQEAAENAILAEAGTIEAARKAEAAARRAAGTSQPSQDLPTGKAKV